MMLLLNCAIVNQATGIKENGEGLKVNSLYSELGIWNICKAFPMVWGSLMNGWCS